jgi:hypothetical protein
MYPNRVFKPIANLINTFHNPENYWNAKNQFFTKSIHQRILPEDSELAAAHL